MKKFCLALAFFGFLAFLYWHLTKPIFTLTPIYLSTETQLLQQKPKPTHPVYNYINIINNKNQKINNIFVSNMDIKIIQNGINLHVNGELAMQKEKNFRLKISHRFTGIELDIGSNQNIFWFWSKRMKNSALYYAKHEDLSKTMLKTPLNPIWLIESLNLGKINAENIEIGKFNNYWLIFEKRLNALKEEVTVVTLIDPEKIAVIGRYLYNKDGNLVASTETKEFITDEKTGSLIPKNLYVIWYAEGIIMNWEFKDIKINFGINQNEWIIPKFKNKIDMGK